MFFIRQKLSEFQKGLAVCHSPMGLAFSRRSLGALSLLLILGLLVVGCGENGGSEEPKAKAKDTSPAAYMSDPVFMKKMKAQMNLRNQLRQRLFKIRERLEKLRAKDPASEEIGKLEAEAKSLVLKFEQSLSKARAITRERLTPDGNLKAGRVGVPSPTAAAGGGTPALTGESKNK